MDWTIPFHVSLSFLSRQLHKPTQFPTVPYPTLISDEQARHRKPSLHFLPRIQFLYKTIMVIRGEQSFTGSPAINRRYVFTVDRGVAFNDVQHAIHLARCSRDGPLHPPRKNVNLRYSWWLCSSARTSSKSLSSLFSKEKIGKDIEKLVNSFRRKIFFLS